MAGHPAMDLDPKTQASITETSGAENEQVHRVFLEPTATDYSAHVPDLPGCIAAGATLDQTRQLIEEAIEFHIEGMRLKGETVPGRRVSSRR
jgi:predicted RNase H-like HicB family nuclease